MMLDAIELHVRTNVIALGVSIGRQAPARAWAGPTPRPMGEPKRRGALIRAGVVTLARPNNASLAQKPNTENLETAGLMKTQAELYETMGALREPAERAKVAAGLDRGVCKSGGRQSRRRRSA
jgi:hypothetical protein